MTVDPCSGRSTYRWSSRVLALLDVVSPKRTTSGFQHGDCDRRASRTSAAGRPPRILSGCAMIRAFSILTRRRDGWGATVRSAENVDHFVRSVPTLCRRMWRCAQRLAGHRAEVRRTFRKEMRMRLHRISVEPEIENGTRIHGTRDRGDPAAPQTLVPLRSSWTAVPSTRRRPRGVEPFRRTVCGGCAGVCDRLLRQAGV